MYNRLGFQVISRYDLREIDFWILKMEQKIGRDRRSSSKFWTFYIMFNMDE
jgi:hypothetical protein